MKHYDIAYFVVNAMALALPFALYLIYRLYRDLKKKDETIDGLIKIITELSARYGQ